MAHKTYYILALTYPFRGIIRLITRTLISIRKKDIVLVFGMSRSGTTVLGRFVSLNPTTQYFHEPVKTLMRYVFQKIHGAFDPGKFWGKFVNSEDQRKLKVHCLVWATLRAVLTSRRDAKTICIKSITLNDVFNDAILAINPKKVVYISRHPCGRTESLIRQLNKRTPPGPDPTTKESLEQFGRSWGKINSEIQQLFKEHPEWRWVLFENLTQDPLNEFEKLYEYLGLEWNETIRDQIQKDTSAKEGGSFYETKRDSSKEAGKWRDVLTEEQVQAIREGCSPYKTGLYESF